MNVSGAALRMAVMGLVVGAVLVACTLGPDYQRAAVSVPVAYKESSAVQPATIVAPADDAWWRLYGDTTLTALVERVTVNNFNLAASEASYRAATAALVSVRAGQWPSITSDVQLTRSLGAQNSGNAVTAGGGSGARTLARLGGAVSWELDLWGRVRRSVEQSRATAAASAADLAVLQLSLRGTLVSTYFALRVAQAERSLLDDNVDALRRALQITQNRYRVGVAARLSSALESGLPFASELSLLAPLAQGDAKLGEVIAVLQPYAQAGVASRTSLAASFPAVAKAALADDLADDSFGERLLGKIKGLVSLRRVGADVQGDAVDAKLARAEAALEAGDIAKAVDLVKSLPPQTAKATSAWLARAEAHLAAKRAVEQLSSHAVTLLGAAR